MPARKERTTAGSGWIIKKVEHVTHKNRKTFWLTDWANERTWDDELIEWPGTVTWVGREVRLGGECTKMEWNFNLIFFNQSMDRWFRLNGALEEIKATRACVGDVNNDTALPAVLLSITRSIRATQPMNALIFNWLIVASLTTGCCPGSLGSTHTQAMSNPSPIHPVDVVDGYGAVVMMMIEVVQFECVHFWKSRH